MTKRVKDRYGKFILNPNKSFEDYKDSGLIDGKKLYNKVRRLRQLSKNFPVLILIPTTKLEIIRFSKESCIQFSQKFSSEAMFEAGKLLHTNLYNLQGQLSKIRNNQLPQNFNPEKTLELYYETPAKHLPKNTGTSHKL